MTALLSDSTRIKSPEAVAISTSIVENNLAVAMGNTSVSQLISILVTTVVEVSASHLQASDSLFDVVDNLIQVSDSLRGSQEEFNSSAR